MPRGTLNNGDRRFAANGDEVVLVHNFATGVPRESLWSVVDHSNELRILDFGPRGSKYRRNRKHSAEERDVKRFSAAEWTELLRRPREMSSVAPERVGVQAVRDSDLVDEEASDAASDAGDVGGGGVGRLARPDRRER